MKTELIADILQLNYLMHRTKSEMSWFTKAHRIKKACRLAATWNRLQVKATGEALSDLDRKTEDRIERELPELCHPCKVFFENLNARLIYDDNREFWFPKLN